MFKDKVITEPTTFPREVVIKYEDNFVRIIHSNDTTDFRHDEDQSNIDRAIAKISPDTRSLLEVLKMCYYRASSRGTLDSNTSLPPPSLNRLDPDYQALRMKDTRLATFHDWPSDAQVSPEQLVEAGFFYTGTIDRVQCAYCRNFLKSWVATDDPRKEHQKRFPDCQFIQGTVTDNLTSVNGAASRTHQVLLRNAPWSDFQRLALWLFTDFIAILLSY